MQFRLSVEAACNEPIVYHVLAASATLLTALAITVAGTKWTRRVFPSSAESVGALLIVEFIILGTIAFAGGALFMSTTFLFWIVVSLAFAPCHDVPLDECANVAGAQTVPAAPLYGSLGTSSGNPGNSCPSSGFPSTNERLCLYIRSNDGAG
jgi:hypothetical protein